jgi:hypothetical protein
MTGSMTTARENHTATLLPNGKVMVTGGDNHSVYLSSSEIYDPATGLWAATGALNTGRAYHKATLLPDGKVLIAEGNTSSGGELYKVSLGYSNAWQPQISEVISRLNLGGSLVLTGAQFRGVSGGGTGNAQSSATDYPLVQLRSIESGQTAFLLTTNWGTNSLASAAVWNFPPGFALATVFVNGIQSTSCVVNVSVPVPVSTTLNPPTNLANGFSFGFTNSVGALFGVLATTNLTLPLTNWTALGGVTELSPGQFQFIDPQATNGGQRFYKIYSP